ncbi:MAG: polyprenyl synthetase family protein [Planctomycetia bacterium]|nr:polyprenyl synthetase family protein [Planctomycetia bacterium]
MHQFIEKVSPSMNYRKFYAPIETELFEVEKLLREFLSCENPFIDRVVHHGFQLGGKRMRPALLLLFAKMTGDVLPQHRTLAAAIETIHTATLIHDDILDEATTRRHLPTVNVVWNNETSVLLGDFMVARAIRQVTELECTEVSHLVAQTSCRLCEGEMRQVGFRGNLALSEETYNSIIQDKTASLCECACLLGVFFSSTQQEWREGAITFGRHLGMAFQIADDLLDIRGEESQMGKSLGTDLAKQKLTLPMIRLLAVLEENSRQTLHSALQNESVEEVRPKIQALLQEHAIYESVCETAQKHIQTAISSLEIFPENPSRTALEELARYVMERKH